MRFSVITVCMNAGTVIEDTLISVVHQDHPDFEYIVVDGGSSDGTLDTLARYRGAIAVQISETDEGIYDAMNKGVRQSRGDFLVFLHAGDIFLGFDILSRVDQIVAAQPADLICGDAIVDYGDRYRLYRHADVITAYELYWGAFVQQACFYRRSLFAAGAVGPFDTRYAIRADQDWHMRFFRRQRGRYVHLPLPVCRYEGASGISSRQRGISEAERRQIQRQYRPLFSRTEVMRMYARRLAARLNFQAAALLGTRLLG